MGASNSVLSTEDFKSYVYGTAVLMLAPRLDSELKFMDCSKITDDDHHVLPMVLDNVQPRDLDSVVQAYCQYYGNGKENAIDRYVSEHILDSEEHINVFMKQLVVLLQDRRNHVEASIKRLAPSQRGAGAADPGQAQQMQQQHHQQMQQPQHHVQQHHHMQQQQQMPQQHMPQQQQYMPQQYMPQQYMPQQQQMPSQDRVHHIKGHGRLQRKLKEVDQAIMQEHDKLERTEREARLTAVPGPEQLNELKSYVNVTNDVDMYEEVSTASDANVDDANAANADDA